MANKTLIGPYSAYAIAVKHGYQGTEEEWVKENEANRTASEQAAQNAAAEAAAASGSAATAQTSQQSAAASARMAEEEATKAKTEADTAANNANTARSAAQQAGQAKEAAAASAAEAAGSAANAQQSAGAANTSAGQAAASASQAAGSAVAAGETLTQVQTAGQEAQQKVKDAETEALDKIAAAAPALPTVSTDAAWQSVTVKPDGTGYNLAALAPIEATIRPTVTDNPAVCENSAAWGLQGLKIYGKSVQDGTPSPESPVPIISAGESGVIKIASSGKNLLQATDLSGVLLQNGVYSIQSETINFTVDKEQNPNTNYTSIILPNPVVLEPGTYTSVAEASWPISDASKQVAIQFWDAQGKNNLPFNWYGTNNPDFNGYKTFAIDKPFTIGALRFVVVSGDFNDATYRFGIFYGNENVPWEPFKGYQSISISTPSSLPGIPVDSGGNYTDADGQQWVCNAVDLGAGTLTQNCVAETLSGMPNFQETPDLPGRYAWYDCLKHTYKTGSYLSLATFAKFSNYGDIAPGTNTFAVSQDDIYFSPATSVTAEEINAQFANLMASDNPPVILAQLATPATAQLSAEEVSTYKALTTYSGTTVVSTTEPVAGLEVQYMMDGNKYRESVDKRLAALEAAQTGASGTKTYASYEDLSGAVREGVNKTE